MAIGNEVIKNNIRLRSGLSSDIKPTTAMDNDEFYEVDTGETYIKHKTSWVKKITPISYALIGTATSGSSTTLGDSTKNFGVNGFQGRSMVITVDNVDYYRNISSSAGGVLSFDTLGDAAASSAIVGSGAEGEGQITINCKTAGVEGNQYSVSLIAGTGTGELLGASLVDNVLIITSPTDGDGIPTDIMAGNIQGLILGIPELDAIFEVESQFTAGALSLTTENIPFSGGADAVTVVDGTFYKIY